MSLIRQSIPALYGGVSQQAAPIRSAIQCEDAVNCSFSVSHGASKRPPLECVTELADAQWGNAFYYFATFTDGSKHLVVVPGNGTIEVYRLSDGAKLAMSGFTEPHAYLTVPEGSDSRGLFRAYTVGDRTYIVNLTVTVEMTEAETAGTIAGTAQTLQDESLGGAAEGSIWKILGDEANPVDTYYAKKVSGRWIEWVAPGIPEEIDKTTMPHVLLLILDDVDPLGIRAEFGDVDWDKRLVGDVKSNKTPTFVGKPLNGIFFTSDRLGFIAGQELQMSETGKHQNFWRTSVTDLLDSDRIDIRLASDDGTPLRWAKPMAKSMIVFSEERQFSLDWEGALTPRTLSSTQATAYPTNRDVEPLNAGPNLYFTVNSGDHVNLYEMFVEDQSVVTDAANCSAHASSYVPAPVQTMAVSNNEDTVFLMSDGKVFTYQFYWRGAEKVQSAWGYWEFSNTTLLDIEVVGPHLYVVYMMYDNIADEVRTFLGRINLKVLAPGLADNFFSHPVNLDQLVRFTPEYNSSENRTYFTLPWPVRALGNIDNTQIVHGTGAWKGRVWTKDYPVQWKAGADANTFYMDGLQTVGPVFVGLKYTQRYTFSEQFVDEQNRAQLNVRLQLRNMSVSFRKTGFFRTVVKIRGIPENEGDVVPQAELVSSYVARTVGDEHFRLNTPQLQDGVYRFPVLGRSSDATITLTNDSYLPSHFQTAEWEALVTSRTRR
jgi:hypothetical protein